MRRNNSRRKFQENCRSPEHSPDGGYKKGEARKNEITGRKNEGYRCIWKSGASEGNSPATCGRAGAQLTQGRLRSLVLAWVPPALRRSPKIPVHYLPHGRLLAIGSAPQNGSSHGTLSAVTARPSTRKASQRVATQRRRLLRAQTSSGRTGHAGHSPQI